MAERHGVLKLTHTQVNRIIRMVPPLRRAGKLIRQDIKAMATRAGGRLRGLRPTHPRDRFPTSDDAPPPVARDDGRTVLRLLSYNIQAGIATAAFHRYVTGSWKHVLPHPGRMRNLDAVARVATPFDIVGLQEVDSGSLRSHFINQTEYLAQHGHFPFWHTQTNRKLGKFAQHAIGMLTRFRPTEIVEYKLPGMIPGRGALGATWRTPGGDLDVFVVHLALGRRARASQLAYLTELVMMRPHVVVMGDLNCRSESPELRRFRARANLSEPACELHTFPSWRPAHSIDHILVSRNLAVAGLRVVNYPLSDHLPVAIDVILPAGLHLPVAPIRTQQSAVA